MAAFRSTVPMVTREAYSKALLGAVTDTVVWSRRVLRRPTPDGTGLTVRRRAVVDELARVVAEVRATESVGLESGEV